MRISHIGDEHIRNHAMATSFGKLDKFDPDSGEDWTQYVERMEYYFLANEITSSDKKRALLISAMGAKSYKRLRNLITPAAPSDKSFRELVEALTKHFCPSPSEIVQRFKFNTRVWKPGESVANYIAELQALSELCAGSTMFKPRNDFWLRKISHLPRTKK